MDKPRVTVGQKLGHELRQYALIAGYLYVCFGALIFYKMAILHGQGISYTPFGLAAIKALILGKFVLLGSAFKLGDRHERDRFVHVVARKSGLFLLVLLVLSLAEEVIVGLVHGRPLAESVAAVTGGSLLQLLATCVIMLLILIPYFAFQELSVVLGENRLRQILFARN